MSTADEIVRGPEILRVCFGEVVPDGYGVLVSLFARGWDGEAPPGHHMPLLVHRQTVQDFHDQLPRVFDYLKSKGVTGDAQPQETAGLPGPFDGPREDDYYEMCSAFGIADSTGPEVVAFAVVMVANPPPERGERQYSFPISYRAMRELQEALPAVLAAIARVRQRLIN